MENEIRRGEVYWINKPNNTLGSEMAKNRPGIIVSSNDGNQTSPLVTVVYLTSQEREPMSTHVLVKRTSSGDCEGNTALCEQIYTVSKSRIGEYMARLSDEDMEAVDKAIMCALDLDRYINTKTPPLVQKMEEPEPEAPVEIPEIVEEPQEEPEATEEEAVSADAMVEIMKLQLEADFYKKQYEAILDRIMQKAKL